MVEGDEVEKSACISYLLIIFHVTRIRKPHLMGIPSSVLVKLQLRQGGGIIPRSIEIYGAIEGK